MSEDDTFLALKRLPFSSFIKGPYIVTDKHFTEIEICEFIFHNREFISPGRDWTRNTEGTGWTFDAFVTECVKRHKEYNGN